MNEDHFRYSDQSLTQNSFFDAKAGFFVYAHIFLKAWCVRSIKMTILKKYQEMQPCHYSERTNIHDLLSDHYPRESMF